MREKRERRVIYVSLFDNCTKDKYFMFLFLLKFSKFDGCQCATFVEILVAKYIFDLQRQPKWLQLGVLEYEKKLSSIE